VTGTSEWG